jgi:hypothetical protein
MNQACPLCNNPQTNEFYTGPRRVYYRCPQCGLIFVAREHLLTSEAEKARYDLHQNDPEDRGYRQFLQQFTQPLLDHLDPPPLEGLDFGSGPQPVLAQMLETEGYQMAVYDPFYAPDKQSLISTYDFVTCTETVEHFHEPAKEWSLLVGLVKPGGWLGIMTQLVEHPETFAHMHYITDATHVSFYSRHTFRFLAERDHLRVKFINDRIILCQKPEERH